MLIVKVVLSLQGMKDAAMMEFPVRQKSVWLTCIIIRTVLEVPSELCPCAVSDLPGLIRLTATSPSKAAQKVVVR